MSPSSRSASSSSHPSLPSTRSTPPTDDGGSKMTSPKKSDFPDLSLEESIDKLEDLSSFPPEVALPAETSHDTLLETTSKDATEIDAIFEQSDSESESPLRPPSIPDYQFGGPRNHSRLTQRDSDDERSGTPPPSLFGPSIRSATLRTAGRVAGDNGLVLPSVVSESPSPYLSRSGLSSSRGGGLTSVFQDVPIFSPFSSQKKRKGGKNGFSRGNPSPSRKGGRVLDIPAAPSPDPSPLVLLHVTLLPLPAQGPASSVLANHLRKMISPTVVARGLLLPHPNDDYEALIEMIVENLGLDQETPPPFKKSATYSFDDCASHSEGSYVGSSEEESEAYCPTCTRRRLKPEYCRHERPRKHRRPYTHAEKWYTINIFASNGLMRSGAWSRSWEEMERIDVEVTVTPGYEDIDPPKTLRPSSQRSEGKRSLQGGFQFKRRPLPGVETTTDEEMPQPKKLSVGRRKPSGSRVPSGSMRSRTSSNYIKQEPLSELEILVSSADKAKEIYEDGLDLDVPIFEPSTEEGGEFVPIWEDNDDKDGKPTELCGSEDSWATDDESACKKDSENSKPAGGALGTEKDEDRRLSAFTVDTAIHHSIVGSSRETSVESEAIVSSESEGITTVSPSPLPQQRKTSNPHRLHPSSRRASREISPAELSNYAVSEKTASRPTSSRNPGNMAIVGLALSDDGAVTEDLEDDKENRHESIDNKENIPVDISDEEPDAKLTSPPLRNRRAVTPKTAGPSPMPSRFSSPDISPDISPMVSRAGSPQPQTTKEPMSRERRRRSIRRSFDRSFGTNPSSGSRTHSRKDSGESGVAPFTPRENSPRGRSTSRSPKQSPSSSPSPLEREDPLPDSLIEKLSVMLKPTIDTLSAIPLPTLLLIAIPFAGLIAFSVNSYVAQRNLDYMVRNFMENQVAREMQIFQQQQQAVPNLNQMPLQVQYAPAPPSILEDIIAEAEKMLPEIDLMLSAEEKVEIEWQEAQKRGLEHESVVYGIQVGGKCVMPQDVPAAIREAASERDEAIGKLEPGSEHPRDTLLDDLDDLCGHDDDAVPNVVPVRPELELETDPEETELPSLPATEATSESATDITEEGMRGRGEQKPQGIDYADYERTGSRSPPAPYRRDRSMERKNFPEQIPDYHHSPHKPVYNDYERKSEAGDIDVGKADVRDAGPDSWGNIPELELPPPIREIPASPSKAQPDIVAPSQSEEPKNTPASGSEGTQTSESVTAEEKDAAIDAISEEDEGSPESVVRTGYTPQQRPYDYKSHPSSRNGDVDESDTTSDPEIVDEDSGYQDVPSRPPTRNGRASSRPPPSRSASKSRASSRSSRSRSRPRSSGGSKSSVTSDSTMATVEEAEAIVEQPLEETTSTHVDPDLHKTEEVPTEIPADVVTTTEAEAKETEGSFLSRFGIKFGPQNFFGPMNKESDVPAVVTPAEDVPSETSLPVVESTVVEQEAEDALSVGSASPQPSPFLPPSEPSSDYDVYEDALDDYDFDSQYEYDPDQYEDYDYDSQDDYHNIPDVLDEDYYPLEDDDGDESAYGETQEFDYEKYKAR
ncbi:hypothetical protein TWF718_002398 [Orbilia javanica]|uniref:Uncharacterized protein n=1 Tax=Orbilia javanica TaxID=47235 RepID=A0AAN8MQH0_9PEZI